MSLNDFIIFFHHGPLIVLLDNVIRGSMRFYLKQLQIPISKGIHRIFKGGNR